jgi:hypothetical protein
VAEGRPISSLVLAELYDSGDASFVDLLLQHQTSFKPLVGIIEKWKKDSRPWARRLKLEFVLRPNLPPDARVVFKRLFKQAWHDGDHELMGACMVACDRMVRRKRQTQYRFPSRNVVEELEVLRVPRPKGQPIFTTPTKHYLRRRAWRYFRRLGFKDGEAYVKAIGDALVRYVDDDVRAGENLIDNWGLMHVCFGKSPVLTFNARHTNLTSSGKLSELQPAPMFERYWSPAEKMAALLDILLRAQCRPVRVWAIQMLRRLHAASLPKIDVAMLIKLIDHADGDVAAFAAELLSNAQTVGSFPMTTWLTLLATRNPTVVASVTDAFRKFVNFDRVTLPQAVALATRTAVPVATLGLEILAAKSIRSDAEIRELAKLANAESSAVGVRIAKFAMDRLNVPKVYRVDDVVAFFDSGLKTLRMGSFAALTEQSPAETDPALWARLFESPYDDVRIELVQRLKTRQELPGASTDATATLWRSVLLNIHRGGRAKLSALRQISDRILREPQTLPTLLPVLTIAIRSVRPPEARHGLAAIVSAVERMPQLADDVKRHLPELEIDLAGAGVAS